MSKSKRIKCLLGFAAALLLASDWMSVCQNCTVISSTGAVRVEKDGRLDFQHTLTHTNTLKHPPPPPSVVMQPPILVYFEN